jgi:phosphotransferase system HPr-like phosphotransfer protein
MAATKILEYYSVKNAHSVDAHLYIEKLAKAESEQDNLIEVLSWQAAADVLQVMGEGELAQRAIDKVNQFIALNTI